MDTDRIIQLVQKTRPILLDPEKKNDISEKGAADYVTAADKGVQDFLERELAQLTPGIGLIAEEKENGTPDPKKSWWILDPVDGTTNLIHDYAFSAVSLALWEKEEVTFGVVYNPFTGELFTAEKGKGAYLGRRKLSVSGRTRLGDSLVSFGASPYRKQFARILFPVYQSIFEKSADFRRGGSAALELCYVAAGRLDAYFEGDLKPWDYAAGQLIAREAGAVCRTFQDKEVPVLARADVLACTPGLYVALRKELEELAIAPPA